MRRCCFHFQETTDVFQPKQPHYTNRQKLTIPSGQSGNHSAQFGIKESDQRGILADVRVNSFTALLMSDLSSSSPSFLVFFAFEALRLEEKPQTLFVFRSEIPEF